MKIFLYFFTKYFLCFFISMIESGNFSMLKINQIKNSLDLFYYCWILLFFPIMNFVIFFLPINYSLKLKKQNFLILNLFLIFVEVLIYIYFTSQKFTFDFQIQILLLSSIICFILFFNKEMNLFSKKI